MLSALYLLSRLDRFLIYVPKVMAPSLKCSANCLPLKVQEDAREDLLGSQLSAPCEVLHPIATKQCFLFPETRLIQYDCGELADNCSQTCMYVHRSIHMLFSLFQANYRLWILCYRNLRVKVTGQSKGICTSVGEFFDTCINPVLRTLDNYVIGIKFVSHLILREDYQLVSLIPIQCFSHIRDLLFVNASFVKDLFDVVSTSISCL